MVTIGIVMAITFGLSLLIRRKKEQAWQMSGLDALMVIPILMMAHGIADMHDILESILNPLLP